MFDVSPCGYDEHPYAGPAKLSRRHQQGRQPSIQHRIEKTPEKHLLGKGSHAHSEKRHDVCALPVLEEPVHGQGLGNGQISRKQPQHHGHHAAGHDVPHPPTARPAPRHRLPERTLPVARHQYVHRCQRGEIGQGHARNNHQRSGISAQLRGRNRPGRESSLDATIKNIELKKNKPPPAPARSAAGPTRSTVDSRRPD